jgi:single-strand DNA-binding protein
MSVNKAIILGNVGKDPEVKVIDSETKVAQFSVATSETRTNRNGEKQTLTQWHNIVAWKGLAEIVEKYVHKGSPIYIEGKIITRDWTDKNNVKHYTTEIVAETVQLTGSKPEPTDFPG